MTDIDIQAIRERVKYLEELIVAGVEVSGETKNLAQDRADLLALLDEAVDVLNYTIDVREIECIHLHPPPDECCAKCKADAFLAKLGASHD